MSWETALPTDMATLLAALQQDSGQ